MKGSFEFTVDEQYNQLFMVYCKPTLRVIIGFLNYLFQFIHLNPNILCVHNQKGGIADEIEWLVIYVMI